MADRSNVPGGENEDPSSPKPAGGKPRPATEPRPTGPRPTGGKPLPLDDSKPSDGGISWP